MSKGKRPRRSTKTRLPGSRRGRNPVASRAGQDLTQVLPRLLGDTAADIRLLFSGDPALGDLTIELAPEANPSRSGNAAKTTPVPVALIEPVITGHLPPAIPGGPPYDLRTAIAVKLGLPVLTAQASTMGPTAIWTLERRAGTLVLIDPTGSVLAQATAPEQSRWRDLAERLGQVVVIYGPEVGVRSPSGTLQDHYDDNARAAELSRSRATGTANGGIVRFVNADLRPA
jgi:hypothetical protein